MIRRDIPALLILLGWSLGTVSGAIFGATGVLVCAPLMVFRGVTIRLVGLSALVGGVALLFSLPGQVDFDPAIGSYLMIVDDVPRYRQPGGVEFIAQATAGVDQRGVVHPLKVPFKALCRGPYLPWRNSNELNIGSKVFILGVFQSIPSQSAFSYHGYLRRQGVQATCKFKAISLSHTDERSVLHRMRERLRERIEQALGEGERSGLVLSMAFGVRDVVSDLTASAFKRTGLAHLLVLSGAQVTAIYLSLHFILRLLAFYFFRVVLYREWVILGGALTGSLVFISITGADPPSIRAGIALVIWVLATLFERGAGRANLLFVTLLILSSLSPGAILDPSVELTFAALTGLSLGFSGNGSRIIQFLRGCFFASLATSAVTVLRFGTLSLLGFILNPTIAPLISLVGVQGVYLAAISAVVGVDPSGVALGLMADILEKLRDLILGLAQYSWVEFKLDGVQRLIVAMLLIMPILLLLLRRIVLLGSLNGIICSFSEPRRVKR